jgi:hypothetical protein
MVQVSRVGSARQVRWSSWQNCSKPAPEAGLEEWIGRCDTICDACVTLSLLMQLRFDDFLWHSFLPSPNQRKIALGPSLERLQIGAYDLATNPSNRDCVLHSW